MSEPLGNFFSTRTHYFREKMSVQNNNLKFLSLLFWKINLSKLTFFFQIFHVILKHIKHVFWPIIGAMKFINYNNRQWPNPVLDTQKCFDTWKENCSETSRKEEFTSKRTFFISFQTE